MEKRGLSTIIVSLIMILIVLVAIGIVWVIVSGILKSSSEQVDITGLTLNMKITEVISKNSNVVDVRIKRSPGTADIVGVVFLFEGGGKVDSVEKDGVINELDEKTFTFNDNIELLNTNLNGLEKISIVPIIKLKSGKEKEGNVADGVELSCSDSDGGSNFIKGEAITSLDTYEDYCNGDSNLFEFYCNSNVVVKYQVVCLVPCQSSAICSNGACVC